MLQESAKLVYTSVKIFYGLNGDILMNDEKKWQQLQNFVSLRNSEDQVTWTIWGIFSAATVILLVALFSDGQLPSNTTGLIITIVGIGLSFIWWKIVCRGLGHCERYENLINDIEKDLIDAGTLSRSFAISGFLNKESYNKLEGEVRARSWMKGTAIVSIFLWFIGFIFFLIRLICC